MTIMPTFWQAVGNLIRDPQSPYPSPGLQPAPAAPRPPIPALDGTARAWSFRPGRSGRCVVESTEIDHHIQFSIPVTQIPVVDDGEF